MFQSLRQSIGLSRRFYCYKIVLLEHHFAAVSHERVEFHEPIMEHFPDPLLWLPNLQQLTLQDQGFTWTKFISSLDGIFLNAGVHAVLLGYLANLQD